MTSVKTHCKLGAALTDGSYLLNGSGGFRSHGERFPSGAGGERNRAKWRNATQSQANVVLGCDCWLHPQNQIEAVNNVNKYDQINIDTQQGQHAAL